MSDKRLLTVHEAAEYLAVSSSTLYGWVWQRRIPFVRLGRAIRFDLIEIENFIDLNRTQPHKREGGSR
jgi:excisionase family DNA binding protein